MKKKKIVIFGWASSVHVKRWAKGLLSRGCDVLVISLGDETIDGIETILFPRSGKFSYIQHASKAAKAALAFQPDIIHVHYAGGFGIWGVQTKFHPLVTSVWGSDIVELDQSFLNRITTKRLLKASDAITATSKSLAQDTLSFYPNGDQKISIIPFGVAVPDTPSEFPSHKNISACFLKHHLPVYAPDILIKAIAIVKGKNRNFKFSMAGVGEMTESLKKLSSDLGLDDTIDFCGHIDHDKVLSFLKEHHFSVMPSRKEAFGVAALESFAASRPVIATSVGGIPEIVQHNQNGLLVAPDNVEQLAQAMLEFISDYEKMQTFGLNGYSFVKEKYRWDKSLDMMTQLYDDLLQK